MHCKYCGAAIPYNSSICPNCGRMISKDQLLEQQRMNNGMDNGYLKKIESLNRKYENKEVNKDKTNIKGYLIIIGILLLIVIIVLIINR